MQKTLSKWFRKFDLISVIVPIIILAVVFGTSAKGFLSAYNLQSVGRITGITLIVGLSQLAVLSIGHFNIALGSMACFSAMSCCAMMEVAGLPVVVAIIIGLAVGTFCGFLQGFLIVKTGINPFIITLALSSIFLGFTIGVTEGTIYHALPDAFKEIGKINFLGLPLLFIIALVVAAILFFVMKKSLLGRQLLVIGDNTRAANFSGIRVNRRIITAHMLSGLLAGIAGILQASRLGVGQSSIGVDWMTISFAAPVLGGTLLSGGKVNIVGTLFGAILMSIIVNGLIMINISQYWFQSFTGIILLVAFEIDRIRRNVASS